jgi:hypothetical protein
MQVLLDTNILIRLDNPADVQRGDVLAALERLHRGGTTL